MTVKTEYLLGDTVWIYGIGSKKTLTEGKVVKTFSIDVFHNQVFYVISIPSHIEPLLEIRTWETISQDSQGPVGGFRDIENPHVIHKLVSRVGYIHETDLSESDDPSADEIHAALEKSIDNAIHKPLIIKEHRQRQKRRFVRKKAKE